MYPSPEEMYEKRKQFFNDHAEKWLDMWYRDETSGRYDAHAAGFARLFAALPLAQGQSVCDIGCGPGVLVPYILERIGPSGLLYEIDVAEKMIDVNRKLHPEPNIRFIADDIANRPVPEASCHAAICFSCFPHFQDKPGALAAVAHALTSGGFLAIAHFDSAHAINNRHAKHPAVAHDTLPGEQEMRIMVETAGFCVLSFIDEDGFYLLTAEKK
jgi:demethylmenaquinone methyltransferase/2-methoxy-6-polyprenyl-1,4-benzoquinol methylase